MESLTELPRGRMLTEADGFLPVLRDVGTGVTLRGNAVPDAHLVAVLRQHGVRTLYTADADFRRFGFLDVRNPLEV